MNLSTVQQDLSAIVGDKYVIQGNDAADFALDWLKLYPSTPLAVVRPDSTAQVSAIVKLANALGIGVVPLGGNTGLTGATQANGCIMISLDRMNAIQEIRTNARIAIVQSGAILSNVHDAAQAHGLIFPLNFGAKGSATIGGVLSTNAGGSNVLKYGNTRDLVLGIEAVLPNGDILNAMSELHKNNSGYDLRHLLIGAEGTLGIITGAVLKLSPQPKSVVTAMIAAASLADALFVLRDLQDATGQGVEAFEYMPRNYIQEYLNVIPGARAPFDDLYDVNIMVEVGTTIPDLIDTDAQGQIRLVSLIEDRLADAMEQGHVLDAIIAQNETQRTEMWTRRECAAELTLRQPNLVNNDVALPLDRVGEFLDVAETELRKLDPDFRVMLVSHLGDGNIHYGVSASRGDIAHKDLLTEKIEEIVMSMGGSFSAEHGIGQYKLNSMRRRKDTVALAVMHQIKKALDPNGIMNPGKLLPEFD